MNEPMHPRLETYLAEVARHAAGRPPAQRAELIDALRRHLADALRARGPTPSDAEIEAILADMDSPETYAESPVASALSNDPPAPVARRLSFWHVLAIVFLLMNGWFGWKLTHPEQDEDEFIAEEYFVAALDEKPVSATPLIWHFHDPDIPQRHPAHAIRMTFKPAVPGSFVWAEDGRLEFRPATPWPGGLSYVATAGEGWPGTPGETFEFETAPFQLMDAQLPGVNEDREVVLRLIFNAPPDVASLKRFLAIQSAGGEPLGYRAHGEPAGNAVEVITYPLMEEEEITFTLNEGFASRDGGAGLLESVERTLELAADLQLRRINPSSPAFETPSINLIFNELIDVADARSFFTLEPAVDFGVEPFEEWQGDGCRLTGPFRAGTLYTLTIKPGLKSVNGRVLPTTIRRPVQMPDRPSAISFAAPGRYLSPGSSTRIPLTTVNLPSVVLQARPILPQNLLQLVLREEDRAPNYYGYGDGDHSALLTGETPSYTVAVERVVNQETRVVADLRDLTTGEPSGAYLLTASAPTGLDGMDEKIVVLTDLGIATRRARDGFLVWVNSIHRATPRAGVEVVLHAVNGAELARGRTAEDGTAFLRLASKDAPDPMVIIARAGDDLSFLSLGQAPLEAVENGTAPYLEERYEASLWSDRGVYRPGETIHLRGLVRDRRLRCPEPFPAVFRHLHPDGSIQRRVPVMLDLNGAAGLDLELPASAATGPHRLELTIPDTDRVLGFLAVQVEEFVPPQIKVALIASESRQAAGSSIEVVGRADHLFGRPAAGLVGSALVGLQAVAFAPSNWTGYVFGDAEKSFSRTWHRAPPVRLDENGKASFALPLGEEGFRPPAALRAVLEWTVLEGGGRGVTAYRSIDVDAYPFYIGLKGVGPGAVEVGATQRVEVIVVDPSGTRQTEARPLKAVWSSVHHTTALKKGPDGRYAFLPERTVTPVREQLVQAGSGRTLIPVTPDNAGEYLLVVSDPKTGASSSLRIVAAARGESWVSWSTERPDRVELTADRERYKPGDTAHLTLKAPFAGQVLMTIESDRIHQQRVFTMTGTTTVLDVPVRGDDTPNVYCSVLLIRPAVAEEVWTPHRAHGSVSLAVEPADARLRAVVRAPATVRPGERMEAVIRLEDLQGRPVEGEAVVAAVDEGICQLTDFETPDPMDDFLAVRYPFVKVHDLYTHLMPILDEQGVASSRVAGDGGASLRKRLNPVQARRFKPLALWQGAVRTDTNGEARVHFDLPEFAGTVRLMCVGWNRQRAGSGEAAVKVKRPLIAQSSLPRFLAPGDRTAATVQLFNESGRAMTGTVKVSASGPVRLTDGTRAFSLAAGGSESIAFSLEATDAAGVATIRIETIGGGETIAESIELAVRPARALEVRSQSLRIEPGQSADLALPAGWINAEQVVRVTGKPAIRLQRGLEYLLQYPYGCLEQTVSSALPLLRAPEFSASSLGPDEAKRLVQAALLRVGRLQSLDGSFRIWPGAAHGPRWESLYATYFLVTARSLGYDAPVERIQLALNDLRLRLAAASPGIENPAEWRDDHEARAFICEILARAGQPDRAWTARLEELADRLSPGARAHLSCALLASGEARRARVVLAATPMPDMGDQTRGQIQRTGIRDAALLLLAWVEQDPAAPAAVELARLLLAAQEDGHWHTTQENAWSVSALGAYGARQPPETNTLRAVIQAGGNRIDVPASGLMLTNNATLTVRNTGTVPVYASSRCEGVPPAGVAEELDRDLLIRREWLDLDGKPVGDRPLQQGELVLVRLTVDPLNRPASDLVIEDLLPAGLEIENPALASSQQRPTWLTNRMDWCLSHSVRDDRMLYFSGHLRHPEVIVYTARAVSPGQYVRPPATVSGMYAPQRRSVRGGGAVTVVP